MRRSTLRDCFSVVSCQLARVRVGVRESMRMRVSASPDLPVGAVATATHGPGDEGTSGHRRSEDDGGEYRTVIKTISADSGQRVRQCDTPETTAVRERIVAKPGKGVRECEGGETTAMVEGTNTNTG